ncbi:MAG TPA: hypothetical protein VFY71_11775 [Planctomycetota bacterium]|nr:hypothetical protein [Planctomycetota bacterium]
MSWPLSIVIALLSGALGLLASGFVMAGCVSWYRISSFEGKSGYAMGAVALLGGLLGTILGLVTSRLLTGEGLPGFLKGVGVAWGLELAIAATAAAIAWSLADIPPRIDGKELMLEVEVKLPVDVTQSPAQGQGESSLSLGSVVNHRQRASERGELRPADARLDCGRWVVPGSVHVFTMRGLRSLDIQLNGEPSFGFIIDLPARPGREFVAWSEWAPRPPAPNPPWPDTKPCYRFRVAPIEPPPPGPTDEQIAAQKADVEQAKFDAMEAGAPIAEWLPWTRYGVAEERKAQALTHIYWRGNLAEEMQALMTSKDADTAAEALRLVEQLPEDPACLVPPVTVVGRDIAARIRRVNETPVAADPGDLGAAEVSVRFSAWMAAMRTLREKCGGDFTPELREILELSRVRSDSQVMRGDVLRVASFWMHEWTGLEPLPTDPPPR